MAAKSKQSNPTPNIVLGQMNAAPLTLNVLNENDSPAERTERCDAAANRKLILHAAEKLFAKHGVAAINMADIAKAAGVGQGTLYRRFANKSELCLALLDTQMSDFQNTVFAQFANMNAARQPKLQQLAWFLDALIHLSEAHFPLLCAVGKDMDYLPHGRPAPWIWQQMTVRGLLAAALQNKEVNATTAHGLDVPLFADLLLTTIHPENFRLAREVDGYDLARISANLQHTVGLLRK